MYKDEIIADVWRNRQEYGAEHDHDLKKIVADLKRRQRKRQPELVDRRDTKKRVGP